MATTAPDSLKARSRSCRRCGAPKPCRSSKRCPSRDVSRDDREGDPADRIRTLTCVADGSTCAGRARQPPSPYTQLRMDCRRRSSSCCHPKLIPICNESGKLVPTSRRWGHQKKPGLRTGHSSLFSLDPTPLAVFALSVVWPRTTGVGVSDTTKPDVRPIASRQRSLALGLSLSLHAWHIRVRCTLLS